MKRLNFTIIFLISILFSITTQAQSRLARGVVLDQDGNPVPAAGVVVKEIKGIGVSCDVDGKFEVSIPSQGRTLVVSSLGMETVEYALPLNLDRSITIVLPYEQNFLDQVVVTGYA